MNDYKTLNRSYIDLLQIEQSKLHHPEGNVLTHSRMVRKAIPSAINVLKELQKTFDVINDLCFDFNETEKRILYMASYLHDVGKVSTTRVTNDKVTSYGHDQPRSYLPEILKLLEVAPKNIRDFYHTYEDTIRYLIDNHMGFFSNKFIAEHFRDSKAINTIRFSMLIVLMWADKMGRDESVVENGISKNIELLEKSAKKIHKLKIANTHIVTDTPREFIALLRGRKVPNNVIRNSLQRKFPALSDHDIDVLLGIDS